MPRDDDKKTAPDAQDTPKKGTRAKSTSPRTATTRSSRSPNPPQVGAKPAAKEAPAKRARSARASSGTSGRSKASNVSREQIAKRAYEIWQQTGNPDPNENWNRAEQELSGHKGS